MADINAAFSIEDGISFDETQTGIFAGTIDPRVGAGEAAPVGSLFIRNNGELYVKTGIADTSWQFVLRQPDVTFDGLAPTTTKGDIIVRAAAGNVRLGVGSDRWVLTADATTLTGVKWARLPTEQIQLDTQEPTGFVNRVDSAISFDPVTRTFTIAPTDTQYVFYYRGTEFVKTGADSVVLPNSTGEYFIWFDAAGVLQYGTAFFVLKDQVPVSIVYWNATQQKAVLVAEERHGITMDWATHQYLHETRGAQYASGFSIDNFDLEGDGSQDSDAQVGINSGVFFDEDIRIEVVADPTPSAEFEQILDAPAEMPVIYRVGSSGHWYRDTATTFPFKHGSNPYYNQFSGGTWSTTFVSDDYYFASYVIATNDINEPVMVLMGQRQDSTLANARLNNTWETLDLSNITFKEWRPIWRLIFRHDNAYTNSVNTRLVDINDYRLTQILQVEVATNVDHGNLTGLGDDDHLQYVHVSTNRTISAQHTIAPTSTQAPFVLGTNAQGQLVTGLNADLLDGLHASAFQSIDADLTAIANYSTIGFAVRSATDTWVTRSILGTPGNISVTNGSGAIGNPIINLVATGITPGTYTKLTVDSYGRSTVGESPTTLAGYGIIDAQPLSTFLTSIANASSSGIMVKDNSSLLLRSISAGSSKISVSNGDGVAGNIVIDLGTVALNDLSDATITTPSLGQSLVFNGSQWVNSDVRLKLYAENPVTPVAPVATGNNSIALGSESEAGAANSLAFGPQSLSRFPGVTQANGRFASQGDAQSGRYLLRSTSINASHTELFLDGTGGSQRLTLPSDSTWMFNITVVGHRTDAADGHAGYRINGVVYRQGSINTVLLGQPTKHIISETDPSWDAFVEVNTDSLVVKVIGETGKTIRWMALVETVEITN